MHKKIAFIDIDGVIYDGHVMFEQIKLQEKKGLLEKGTWIKIFTQAIKYKIGLSSYSSTANKMLITHAKGLRGRSSKVIENDVYQNMLKQSHNFFPYLNRLISLLRNTHDIYIVSNNFQFVCRAVGKVFGISKHISSIAEVKNSKFTGNVKLSLVGKKSLVSNLINQYGKSGSIAIGNSLNDADMLDQVAFPFIMEPNAKTELEAQKKSWIIVNRDNIIENILQTNPRL